MHVSPVKKVLIGKDGWLFLTINNMIEDYRGLDPYKKADIETIARVLDQRQQLLTKLGIKYLLVVAPNKQSIYPEFMPGNINKVGSKTRLDQLKEFLVDKSNVNFLDLRQSLLHEKSKLSRDELLYLTQDSHWNHRGAFISYRSIIDTIRSWYPEITALNLSDRIDLETRKTSRDDLANMIGFPSEIAPLFTVRDAKAKKDTSHKDFIQLFSGRYRENYKTPFISKCENSSLRVAIFRDSFFTDIIPFISENFAEIIYFYEPYNEQIVSQLLYNNLKPDVIIEEIVERDLWRVD